MAIKDSSAEPKSENTNTGANSNTESRNTASDKFSFHAGSIFGAPISRGVGSEFYSKLKTKLIEVFKQSNENVEIALLDLDNINEPALAFSSIIVALRYKNMPEVGIAYHLLILEPTGEKIAPFYDNANGTQIEILRTTSDALDDILQTKALDRVRKAFPKGPWYMVDACVVPTGFNPEDQFAVHRLALNAGLAAGTEIELHSANFRELNLGSVQADNKMNITIGFQRQQIEDAVANPMRSDVLIQFSSKKQGSNARVTSVNTGDREVKISEISSFLDLVWNPVNPMGMVNPYVQQMQPMTQKYSPRLVITNLASNYSYTPGSVLLALATSLSLRDDNNWIQAFRPMPSSGHEIDMADIGALNIEANLSNEQSGFGTRIDTKSDSFRLEDLGQMVAALIQPGLIVSMDCPESGPQSWYLSVFAAAANTGSSAAYNVIYDAADSLTNGSFGRNFTRGTPIFTDLNNRIHLGTWSDRNGNKRDIRDIDHLAVCNLVGERNPQLIRAWSDTFLRQEYPLAMRLAERKKMISGLTNETAQFTGFAQRVTFTSAFMEALARGIREAGMSVSVNTPLSGKDFSNQRGVATFAGSALLVPGQTFMTQGGMMAYNGQFSNQGGYYGGRW